MFCLFIAHLFDLKYAASTVNTYVTALSYSHKRSGFPDPFKAFVLVQMLKAYGKLGARLNRRFPITVSILHKFLESTTLLPSSPAHTRYDYFKPRAVLPFFAFLRVGEMTFSSKEEARAPPLIHQLSKLLNNFNEVVGFKLKFPDPKRY